MSSRRGCYCFILITREILIIVTLLISYEFPTRMINLRGQLLRKLSSSRKTVKLCLRIGRKSVSSRYMSKSGNNPNPFFLPFFLSCTVYLSLARRKKKKKLKDVRKIWFGPPRYKKPRERSWLWPISNERTGNEGDPAISSDGRQRSDKFMAFPTDLFPGPRWLLRIADYSRSNFREETGRKEMETRVSLSGGQ